MRVQLQLRQVDLIKQSLEEFYTPLVALLSQNGTLFDTFGPRTFPEDSHRRAGSVQVWNELRERIILPNNEAILKLLTKKSHLISTLDCHEQYTALQNHIVMYKIFSASPNEVYNKFKFPSGIVEHAKSQRDYLVDLMKRSCEG